MSPRIRAFTLVEVLVAMGLGLALLTLTMMFMVEAFRYAGKSATQGEIQQQLATAFSRLEMDLRVSAAAGLSLQQDASSTILSMVPQRDVTTEHQPLWADNAILYSWDSVSQKLRSKTWPPKPPDLAGFSLSARLLAPLPQALLHAVVDETNGTEKTLAIGVQVFSVAPLSNPLVITLRAARSYSGGDVTFELTRRVALRNAP